MRRSSAQGDATLRDIDAEVTFEETSQVLQGLSRGDEAVVELSLVITAHGPQALDPEYFHTEKKRALPMLSVLGLRP